MNSPIPPHCPLPSADCPLPPFPPSLDLASILLGEDDSTEPFADDDLIPARMLNEFTYCPRLAYLEWVQGEFSDNLDTRQGTFGHRNVDKPSSKPVAQAASQSPLNDDISIALQRADDIPILNPSSDAHHPAVPVTTRALTLSAPREGLVAKLDVLELEGSVVTPVDYKKGSIPDNPFQAWEPERVQLCAQGLILRENGYTCEYGELYYIESRRRVVIPFDDALVMRTRELVKRLREMAAAQRMPPPLVNSPKCPRCSLVGICLPDETNLLLSTAPLSPDDRGEGSGQRANDDPILNSSRDTREPAVPERANDEPILNPSCDAREPAVPERANDEPILNPSRDAREEPLTLALSPDYRGEGSGQRANDDPILNPSCDAHKPAVPVRRLLPARDDALPLYVKEQGAFVGKDGDRVVVRHKEAKLVSVPLIEVSQVSLFGNVQMSAQALREIVDRGIPVCHFSYGGWFHAMTNGHVQKNIELRIAQFAAAADPERSLALAKGFIMAKIKNSRTMLRRHGRNLAGGERQQARGEVLTSTSNESSVERRASDVPIPNPSCAAHEALFPEDPGEGMEQREIDIPTLNPSPIAHRSAVSAVDQLAEWVQKAERATSAATLLGLEGMAAKTYFAGFSKILKGGVTFDMTCRNRRPPRDPVNAVLSFVYALLTKELTIAVQAVGFDPLLGFFHKPRYGRPSLALDLAEEFRPIIADSTAMMVINNGEVNPSSFLSRAGAVALTEPGRKAVIAAFERRMEQEITHPIFGYKISYRRVLEVQARLLSRVVLGELATYPGFCTR